MHFERETPCSQVEYNYSFDYRREISERTDVTQGTLLSTFFNHTSLSPLMALLFALGSLTFVITICACQLRPAWLSFHKINWAALALPLLIDNRNQGFWIFSFGLTQDSYLKENKYKQDPDLRFVLLTFIVSCVFRLSGQWLLHCLHVPW